MTCSIPSVTSVLSGHVHLAWLGTSAFGGGRHGAGRVPRGCLARPPSGLSPVFWRVASDSPLYLSEHRPDVSLSRALLLALASSGILSPAACGWHLLRERTSLTESWWGLLRSQCSCLVSVGRCSPPGLSGSACRSVDSAAGALSCAILAPAHQPLALGHDHDGSSHLCLRCPSILARQDTRREAARVRRLSPLQAVANQARAWGICCHSGTEREGLAPS
jgi:hypothetical protein